MKKASFVLGIIGSIVSFIIALICIVCGIIFMTLDIDSIWHLQQTVDIDWGFFNSFLWGSNIFGQGFVIFGVYKALCGILGLISIRNIKLNSFKAGIIMLAAAIVSLIPIFEYLSVILFTLGGIFALIKEKPSVAPVQPPVE